MKRKMADADCEVKPCSHRAGPNSLRRLRLMLMVDVYHESIFPTR